MPWPQKYGATRIAGNQNNAAAVRPWEACATPLAHEAGHREKALAPGVCDGQISAMNFRSKIVAIEDLPAWRKKIRDNRKRLVVTNGCFDILHLGHVTYLEAARNQGDVLLVGMNSDAAVGQLKGPSRPVNAEEDRAGVLAALESVDGVCIYREKTATNFLGLAEPDIYVKGGDYTIETLNQEERAVVEKAGAKIVIIPFVPGKSTTALLEKIVKL